MKREFTGVFIPAKIWADPEMTPAEKMLLGEIKALSEKTGWCNANNQHFADWLHCSRQNVSMYISGLTKKGCIEVEYADQKTFAGRRMKVNLQWYHGVQSNLTPLSQVEGGLSQVEGGLSQVEGGLSQVETEIQYKYNLNTCESNAHAKNENSVSLNAEENKKSPSPNSAAPLPAAAPGWQMVDPAAEVEVMRNDQLCREHFFRQTRLSVDRLEPLLSDFLLKVKSEGHQHNNRKDFRSHFFSWARLNAGNPGNSRQASTANQPNTGPSYSNLKTFGA